jgi:hypothetical protein
MKLRLDTISSPATGSTARRIIRAVDSGKCIVNAQAKAFIASLLEDLRPKAQRPTRTKRG